MGKQVKTPRFYVDIPTFLHATGETQWGHGGHSFSHQGGKNYGGAELLYLNPSNPFMRDGDNNGNNNNYMFKIGINYPHHDPKTAFPVNFCALVNHNFASQHINWGVDSDLGEEHTYPWIRGRLMVENPDYPDTDTDARTISSHALLNEDNLTDVLNFNTVLQDGKYCFDPIYNGTSIATWDTPEPYKYTTFEVLYSLTYGTGYDAYSDSGYWGDGAGYPHQLGSFVVGKYWDAPNSPDLNLTMSRRFDGIKKQKTIGGKTLANIYYDGPTEWTMNRITNDWGGTPVYKYPPFELDARKRVNGHWTENTSAHFNERSKSGLGRKGLRSWKLTFSYIAESDMWTDYEVSNSIVDDSGTTQNQANVLEDDSFNFVWNCTLGGALPFIFTDDKDSNEPDRYAICTFRENSLNVQQVAYNTYKLSVTIDEVA